MNTKSLIIKTYNDLFYNKKHIGEECIVEWIDKFNIEKRIKNNSEIMIYKEIENFLYNYITTIQDDLFNYEFLGRLIFSEIYSNEICSDLCDFINFEKFINYHKKNIVCFCEKYWFWSEFL